MVDETQCWPPNAFSFAWAVQHWGVGRFKMVEPSNSRPTRQSEVHPKRQQLEQLFERWRSKYPPLVQPDFHPDGVIDEERFYREKHRLLFVLKEPNSQGNEYYGKDLREVFALDRSKPISATLGSWSSVILDGESVYCPDRSLADNLLRVAITNLKKLAGTASSKLSEIRKYAEQDRELICEQIRIIEPTVIVACGSGIHPLTQDILTGDRLLGHIPMIASPHPSFRGRRDDAFYSLLSRARRDRVGAWADWRGSDAPRPASL